MKTNPSDRRRFLSYFSAVGLGGSLFPGTLLALQAASDDDPITVEMIAEAEKIAGLSFTPEEREMLVRDLNEQRDGFKAIRAYKLTNDVLPAFYFDPMVRGKAASDSVQPARVDHSLPEITRPASDEDVAFLGIRQLASLLTSGQLTSVELTTLYLNRLKAMDPLLECVITYTEERAMRQARQADAEITAGNWRGPLHGIPWGAKDLLAVKGYPTTWGAVPYRDQVLDYDAAVVEKLDAAGAVLVAKLTLGALAWGDVWFGGRTKNPRNPGQGSGGSSAGPAAAVAAGLVGFAIGSETLGSIVSPSNRCGVTGLRPTFGRVSKYGAMALSWTMDKLGPMCRSVDDCALVFAAIEGYDPRDVSTREGGFTWPPAQSDMENLRVGYLEQAFERDYPSRAADQEKLARLRAAGYDLLPVQLPQDYPLDAMMVTLNVEAAAAFDDLTLTRGIDKMVRQTRNSWPHSFRTARFVPAVEYIQANRLRTRLMHDMNSLFETIDVLVAPSFAPDLLGITNLTGHPCTVFPHDWTGLEGEALDTGAGSMSVIGGIGKDELCLAVADRLT